MRARALLRRAERSAPAAVFRGVESSSSPGLEGVRRREGLVVLGVGVCVLLRFFGGRPRFRGVTFGCSSLTTAVSWSTPLDGASGEVSGCIGSMDLVLTPLLRLRLGGAASAELGSSGSVTDRDRLRGDRSSSELGDGSGTAFFLGIMVPAMRADG